MVDFITARLERMGVTYAVDKFRNIYATKGSAQTYPCIAAHTDEVHRRTGNNFEAVRLRNDIIFGYDNRHKSFCGIGADDKNGIWICLKYLEEFDALECVFFTGEETGCTGSRNSDMGFFGDCRFVLQCDRKGAGDFINRIGMTELCSDEFIKAVNPAGYGYKTTNGLLTDVETLKGRGLKISCANISCGYYNPHTDNEYTDIAYLRKCLKFVRHIVRDCRKVIPIPTNPGKPVSEDSMVPGRKGISTILTAELPYGRPMAGIAGVQDMTMTILCCIPIPNNITICCAR